MPTPRAEDPQGFPPCPHCTHGWLTVFDKIVVDDRPIWPHELAGLPPQVRQQLPPKDPTTWDLISLRQPSRPRPYSYESPRACCCLCPAGRAKLRHVPRAVGAERILPQDELDRLWPNGPPREETRGSALEQAGVPPLCWTWTLESYKKRFARSGAQREILRLADDWLGTQTAGRTDLVLFGPNGTGKTGLAVGLLIQATDQGERTRYVDARHLFMGWRETFRDGAKLSEQDYLRDWETIPTLVVDEVQAALTDKSEAILQLLVDRRQKMRRPTVLIVNVPADLDASASSPHLAALFGPALMDRLRERAQFWPLLGKSGRRALTLAFDKDAPKEREQ